MIISIATQKGGAGKTTTALALSAGLARKGNRTLLIDVDSQSNSAKVLLPDYQSIRAEQTLYTTIIDKNPLPIHQTSVPNLSVVPSHILLANTDFALTTALDHREARLKHQLDKIKDDFDFILLDCPPALSWLTLNALTASDKVLIVVAPGYFELDSLVQMSETINDVRKLFNSRLQLAGLLFVMSEPTINSRTSLQILRQTYTTQVLNAVVPRNTDIKDAHFNKQDIFAYNPNAASAKAYEKVIRELFNL